MRFDGVIEQGRCQMSPLLELNQIKRDKPTRVWCGAAAHTQVASNQGFDVEETRRATPFFSDARTALVQPYLSTSIHQWRIVAPGLT